MFMKIGEKNIVSEREAYHTYSVSIIAQQCINMWGKYIPGTTLYIWRIRFLHITHCGHVRHMLEQCYFQIHVFLCQIFSSNRLIKTVLLMEFSSTRVKHGLAKNIAAKPPNFSDLLCQIGTKNEENKTNPA